MGVLCGNVRPPAQILVRGSGGLDKILKGHIRGTSPRDIYEAQKGLGDKKIDGAVSERFYSEADTGSAR